jgi:hypothetical protein
MNVQEIAVVILFLAALAYIVRLLYRTFKAKNSCGNSCKCGVDFNKL